MQPAAIAHILREGYDVQLFTRGVRRLAEALELDLLLIDTHPGLNEETLPAMVMAQKLLIVLRPDAQAYEGTAVALQVARELEVPDLALIVNNVPDALANAEVKTHVEQTFGCPVLAALPHLDDVMRPASGDIFALTYPDHPAYILISGRLQATMADASGPGRVIANLDAASSPGRVRA
jgi:septum site-determining protein MinD